MNRPSLLIDVSLACAAWETACPGVEGMARAAACIALARRATAAGPAPHAAVELSIVLADDAAQRRLNHDWRGIDRPTNVLAFPAWEAGVSAAPEMPLLLGDVVLALETVSREAAEQNKTIADHLSHLVVHGVLHLVGYDHQVDEEAAVMEALEGSILAELGVADPYRVTM